MFDIHCHILHGVDDGSDSFEESVKMVKIAESGGTSAIIATPHSNVPGSYQNHWNITLAAQITMLNSRLSAEGVSVRIFPGQEIFAAGSFLSLLKSGKLLTLNNSVYPLVEFDFYEYSESVYMKLEQLVAEGFVPIVAHPERYAFVNEEEDAIIRLKDIGCLLQVNKGSLKGSFGRAAHFSAHRLLASQLADFVASDGHGPYVRTPYLEDVHEMISEMYSLDYAELLLRDNPKLVIENKKIEMI